MPALNFDERFASSVRSGRKRQTIRKLRKRPFREDDNLTFWVRQRRPDRAKIGEGTCLGAIPIKVSQYGLLFRHPGALFPCAPLVRVEWTDPLAAYLSVQEGFVTVEEMLRFFEPRFPVRGQLIWW